MAKTPSKIPAKKVAKKAAVATKSKAPAFSIEIVSEEVLKKLQELGLDSQLQADLEWCLGSYRADKNPEGLYDMLERARKAFEAAKANKAKGITAKLTADVEKALKSR